MARKKRTQHPIEPYEYRDKERAYNLPVASPDTDPEAKSKTTYANNPHLKPQLVWTGKVEHTLFEVPTVSLPVHEHIDLGLIIAVLRWCNGNGGEPQLPLLFEFERKKLLHPREAHPRRGSWTTWGSRA